MYFVIDLGSTKTEVLLYGDRLNLVASSGFETPFRFDGKIEYIEPESYMREILHRMGSLCASHGKSLKSDGNSFCTVTGMGSTVLAVDGEGEVLVPALSWEFRAPQATVRNFPLSRTGKLPLPTYPLYKISWILEHCGIPDPMILSLPDYALAALVGFGNFVTDYSFASRSLLFDDTACDWDNEILDSAGICRKNLPVLTAAGSVMGKLDPGIKRRFRLPGAVFVCSGMHDHVATAFLGSEISQGKRYVVNPAGTTESIVHRINDPQKRDRLVTDAPSFGMNTESAWSTAELALVAYPSLSGKIFEAAHRFGVEPSSIFREPDPRICVIPSRRRLVVEDHGMIVPLRPGTVSLEEFWRSYILGTQFEFLKAIHDIELLTESNPYEAVLLFGGQSNSHDICRLKSAVSGIPVIAYPGLNGAALGTASHIARTRGAFTELPLLESSRREYMATEEEIKRFHYQYLRYRENSENARFEEENP